MPPRLYATLGRAAENDVVLDHATVSNHHARLSWSGSSLLVEDLSSANGTFVDGQRVKSARMRPGAELRVGQVVVPWSHEGLRALLKAGVGARTLVMPSMASVVCGACGRVAALPPGNAPKTFTCPGCGATLRTASKPKGSGVSPWSWLGLLGFALVGGGLVYVLWQQVGLPTTLPTSARDVENTLRSLDTLGQVSPVTAQRIAAALTPSEATTRDTAVKLASRSAGPYHVEQVAEIWNAVRTAWRYVNDPRGEEYFATASETIQNGYVGDCDDFATTLASMVLAIGGEARVVVMDGPQGGHAYAEVCVQGEPQKIASELNRYYHTRWKKYLAGYEVPRSMAYRTSSSCPIWLNLDWNSIVPGGAYQPEHWAVAIYPDGHSEALAVVSPAPGKAKGKPGTAASP